MQARKLQLPVASILLALHTSIASADIVATAAAGSSISGLIDQLQSVAEKIIHELDDKVGLNAFRIRQDMTLVISELNNAALELEGKTFKDLNSTQKSFFQQSEVAILVARDAVQAPLDQLGEIQVRMSDTISGLPFARKTARVLKVEPHYIVSTFYGSVDPATLASNINADGVKPMDELIKFILNPTHIKELDEFLKQTGIVMAVSAPTTEPAVAAVDAPPPKTFVEHEPQPNDQVPQAEKADYSGQYPDVPITITGSDLNYGPASLTFGSIPCTTAEQLDSRLTFTCPGQSFIANSSIERRSGDLVVTDFQPWYKRFWSWLIGKPAPTRSYKTLVTVVPQKLGDYKLTALVAVSKPIAEQRSQPISAGNGHCAGSVGYNVRVNKQGDPSWSIDFATVNIQETSGNQGRSVVGPLETGPTGFIVAVNLQNGGGCGPNRPFSGDKLWYDARAWFNGTVTWKETKTITENVLTEINAGPLFWDKDLDFTLPDGTQEYTLKVSQVDGSKQVVIGEEQKSWFRVKNDASKKFLVLSPKSLTDAMR